MKIETNFEKMLGQYLPQHFTESDVKGNVGYSQKNFNKIEPCQKCHKCTAGDGTYKNAYRSKHEARLKANIIFDEQGISLRTYKCKYGSGWHLTKDKF
jgi:hypothetical protein